MNAPKLTEEEARQAKSGQKVRYVLGISIIAAVVVLALVFGLTPTP